MGKNHPSKKQLTTLQLLNQDPELSPTKAMLMAGYSKNTARNPGKKLLKTKTTATIIEKMRMTLMQQGITEDYLASKLAQFAQTDNSKVFFGAYDRIAKVIGIEQKQEPQPARRFTFEEWVSDDTQKAQPLEEERESELKSLQAMDNIELDRHGEAIYSPPNPPKALPINTIEQKHQTPIISNTPPFKEQAKRLAGYSENLDIIPDSQH